MNATSAAAHNNLFPLLSKHTHDMHALASPNNGTRFPKQFTSALYGLQPRQPPCSGTKAQVLNSLQGHGGACNFHYLCFMNKARRRGAQAANSIQHIFRNCTSPWTQPVASLAHNKSINTR